MCTFAIRIIVVASVVVAGSAFSQPGGDPIPAGPSSMTTSEVASEWLDFYRRNTVEAFRQQAGYAEQPWFEDAVEFLEGMIALHAMSPDAPTPLSLLGVARRVERAGCKDPVFLYHYVQRACYYEDENSSKHAQILQEAIAALRDGQQYTPNHLAIALDELADLYGFLRYSNAENDLRAQIAAAWTQAIGDRVYSESDQRLLFREIRGSLRTSDESSGHGAIVKAIDDGMIDADPWLSSVLRGQCFISRAWEERSSNVSDQVTEKQWAGFHENLRKAREHLLAAYRSRPENPEAAELMIDVTNGEGAAHRPKDESERLWFDRAVRAQADWRPAYEKYIWAIMPRWSGTPEEMLAFGEECLATGRFDTRIPYFYIDALLTLSQDTRNEFLVLKDDAIFEQALDTIDRLVENPAFPQDDIELTSLGALFCWYREDSVRASEYLRRVTFSFTLDAHAHQFGLRKDEIQEEILLLSSPVADAVRDADATMARAKYRDAASAYQAASDALQDTQLKRFVRDRAVAAVIAADFHDGHAVDLRFDDALSGWSKRGGTWRRIDDTTVQGFPDWRGLALVLEAPIGRRFEVSGEFDISKMTHDNGTNAVVMTEFVADFWNPDWRGVGFYRGESHAAAMSRFGSDTVFESADVRPGANTFRILFWDDQVAAYLNDAEVYRGRLPKHAHHPPPPADEARLAIGGRYWYTNGEATFSNLRIRKLTARPNTLQE